MFKKIIFGVLIFGISTSISFASDVTIENFLQNRLHLGKNFFSDNQQNLQNFSQKSLLQKNAIIKKEFIIENFILSGKIFLKNPDVQSYIFLTQPNGRVTKFEFVFNNKEKISFQIPIFENGKYQIEILDSKGLPIINEIISFGEELIVGNQKISTFDNILNNINNQRERFGYDKIEYSSLLQKIAIRKIEDMKAKKYIGHTNSNGENIFAFVSLDEKKFFKRLGENISGGKNISLADAYEGILNSPGHKYLLLLPAWKKIGMHYVEEDGIGYFVQIFSD